MPHSDHGLVQSKAQTGMEVGVSIDADKLNLGLSPSNRPGLGKDADPWWKFLSDTPGPKEEKTLVWNLIPQISVNPILCETILQESLTGRRMMENQAIATAFMGNRHATKLLQVFQPTTEFSIHLIAKEKMIGVLEHCVTLMLGRG